MISKKKPYLMYLLAFFVPFLILILCSIILQFSPFGDNSFLISDLYAQYYPFHALYRQLLLTQNWDGFLFQWQLGLGQSFLGTFAYYLTSPFSLLTLLCPASFLPQMLWFIVVLKLSFASLSFYWLTQRQTYHSQWLSLCFAWGYGLMGYAITYSLNLMWLDQLIVLPLLIHSLYLLIVRDKLLPFFLSLVLCFWVNFYLAYMTGLFLFIWFHLTYFNHHAFSQIHWKHYFKKLSQFLLMAILSATLLAFLLLPTAFELLQTSSSDTFSIHFVSSPLDWLSKLFIGNYDGVNNEASPQLSGGLLAFIGFCTVFRLKTLLFKQKHFIILTLILFVASFLWYPFDIIWHGFKAPIWFPFRYSFLLTFFMSYVGHGVLNTHHLTSLSLDFKWFVTPYVILSPILLCFAFKPDWIPTITSQQITFTLLFLFLTQVSYRLWIKQVQHQQKPSWLIVLVVVTIGNLFLNTLLTFQSLHKNESFLPIVNPQTHFQQTDILDALPTKSEPYRLHLEGNFSSNAHLLRPNLLNFNTFNTLANTSVIPLQERFYLEKNTLNLHLTFYRHQFFLVDCLFGHRYIYSLQPLIHPYQSIQQTDLDYLYQNPYALSLGYVVSDSILDVELEAMNPFDYQTQFVNLLLGYTEPNEQLNFYEPIDGMIYNSHNLEHITDTQSYSILDPSKDASLQISFYSESSDPLYIYTNTSGFMSSSDYKIQINETEPTINAYYRLVSYQPLQANETISYEITAFKNLSSIISMPIAYHLKVENAIEAINLLSKHSLQNITLDDDRFTGDIQVNDSSLLMLTIPYHESWHVTSQGETLETVAIQDGLLGVWLPAGSHHLEFEYIHSELELGLFISSLSAIITFNGFLIYGLKKYFFH